MHNRTASYIFRIRREYIKSHRLQIAAVDKAQLPSSPPGIELAAEAHRGQSRMLARAGQTACSTAGRNQGARFPAGRLLMRPKELLMPIGMDWQCAIRDSIASAIWDIKNLFSKIFRHRPVDKCYSWINAKIKNAFVSARRLYKVSIDSAETLLFISGFA